MVLMNYSQVLLILYVIETDFENFAALYDLPIKYDILNGQRLNLMNFMTRAFNAMFSPKSFNLTSSLRDVRYLIVVMIHD